VTRRVSSGWALTRTTSPTPSASLPAEEVTEGVDYLENREEVVRFPHPLETPLRVELKPGRGWAQLRGELSGHESHG
jgi:hypothetical protein